MNKCVFIGRLLRRNYFHAANRHILKPPYIIKQFIMVPFMFINDYTYYQWNISNSRQIFTHKRNKFGMIKHWRRKRKKVLIRKSLIPWRPEKKTTRSYKMPKERRVFKIGWSKNKKGGRMLKIRRQR
ncbi:conserved Plasmodium protein, unknown function [Babesia microti strain RI]|uniref:Uncharacterized protein n=1 Tax=Babesia microti (strain RI) TaxID=1133968 RepID=I7J8X0_BABMR|nr:conserved Plasmodium protein, unknown function [Babesia microti strain RI]CCF73054.1 conserved Plasmodium protein, unknown function [Babesia microti strain RI]|eukprot:XP_012647663.1 conserved Plasmodium protein, unknown function [Babesia microti strain RI]